MCVLRAAQRPLRALSSLCARTAAFPGRVLPFCWLGLHGCLGRGRSPHDTCFTCTQRDASATSSVSRHPESSLTHLILVPRCVPYASPFADEKRVKGSQYFAMGQADSFDNPVYAIPPLADGTHGEVTGTARVTGHSHGHDVLVEGSH